MKLKKINYQEFTDMFLSGEITDKTIFVPSKFEKMQTMLWSGTVGVQSKNQIMTEDTFVCYIMED